MKNKKGFTLIELLAVIVILGLLMAIAIPSVTKYITQSRKKTVVSSIDGYISSTVNSVNDQDFKFSTPNTIYAVPIECIAVEKGGTNPFGEWLHANKDYWAYVLVQYDSENFSYNYGFTFKDSAGYGMYPTIQSEINPKSKTQIQTGLELTKPTSGKALDITTEDNWNGFKVDSDTNLVVLDAESEGIPGNGETTCTLCQKGSNYEEVEKNKPLTEEQIKDLTLIATTSSSTTAFWGYRDKIKTITFQDSINIPSDITDEYKWDVSSTGNGKVMAYITPNASNSSYYDLYIQSDDIIYGNSDSSYLFYNFIYVDSINNIEILDTSNVTNMSYMFAYTGSGEYYNDDEEEWEKIDTFFTLDLGDKFDTSKVTDMSGMFYETGYSSSVFTLDLGDKFDTSNVTSMYQMFCATGYSSSVFTLDLGDKFDTSNVTIMSDMFSHSGYSSSVFTLDLGDDFDTSNVTGMYDMFEYTGYSSSVFTLDLGDKFDTSNVTSMNWMFKYTGYSSPVFTLDLGDKFDTSNVTSMIKMFENTGYSSPVFTLDLGDKFDTSNVTSMQEMFYETGYSSSVFTLDLGDKFDTSKVMNMRAMFRATGYSSPVFTLDLGDKFDTRLITDMDSMFEYTGYSSSVFTLDLGDKFYTSQVRSMNSMFESTGYSSLDFKLDLGDKFYTSLVKSMSSMFKNTGYSSPVFTLDCRKWQVGSVKYHSNFNDGVETKVIKPTAWS